MQDEPGASTFPYERRREKLALIGVNTGCSTLPFMATGCFDQKQADALRALLSSAKDAGLFRIVMIHHPPFENATSFHKRLVGASLFREVVADVGAELVLHGHTHINSHQHISAPNKAVPIIGVPSASHGWHSGASKPAARYNMFEVGGAVDKWTCTMTEYGVTDASNSIQQISENRIY